MALEAPDGAILEACKLLRRALPAQDVVPAHHNTRRHQRTLPLQSNTPALHCAIQADLPLEPEHQNAAVDFDSQNITLNSGAAFELHGTGQRTSYDQVHLDHR